MKTFDIVRIAVALSLALMSAAWGSVVTIHLEGAVTHVRDNLNAFGGNIVIGDKILISYSYDLSNPGNPTTSGPGYEVTLYPYQGDLWDDPIGIHVTINGYNFISDPDAPLQVFHTEVWDYQQPGSSDLLNAGSSRFLMNVNNASIYDDIGMGVQLRAPYDTLASSSQPKAIDPSVWTNQTGYFSLFGNASGASGFSVSGSDLSVVAIPEISASFTLAAFVLLGLVWIRQRES